MATTNESFTTGTITIFSDIDHEFEEITSVSISDADYGSVSLPTDPEALRAIAARLIEIADSVPQTDSALLD